MGSLDSGEGARHPLMSRTTMDIDACDRTYDKAVRFVEHKKFKKAIKILQKIPEEYPDIADVYSVIAFSYVGLERSGDVLKYFEKAANAAPWEWSHWCSLAGAYLVNGRVSKARKCLDKVNEVGYPSDAKDMVVELRNGIAEYLDVALSDKQYLDADTYLALEDRFYEGIAYMADRDWGRAIEEFKYIVRIDERSEKAYGNLGVIHLLKGEFDEAKRYLKRALELDPEYPPASVNLAILDEIREEVAKDPGYLKKLEDRLLIGHF